jgi:hypothetical protein
MTAFVVEDGTGLLAANSYLSENGFFAYWDITNSDWDYTSYSDDEVIGALVRATTYLDNRYRGRWPGVTVNGRLQGLAWPRTGAPDPRFILTSQFAEDADGNDIDSASVPREVIAACAECAMREVVQPYVLSPDKVSQRTLSESVSGAVAITYERMGDQRPVVVVVDEILAGLISAPATANFLMRA